MIAVGSSVKSLGAISNYLMRAPAHDLGVPGVSGRRHELVSTIGATTPETFVADVTATKERCGSPATKVEAFHLIISSALGELDPNDPAAHQALMAVARRTCQESFPGRKALIVIQADNAALELVDGKLTIVPGKLHAHCVVENVAAYPVELNWTDRNGNQRTKNYRAGRAMDGDMRNIHRIRSKLDDVVSQQLGYDNKEFVLRCGKVREGRSGAVSMAQLQERLRDGVAATAEVDLAAQGLDTDAREHVAMALGVSEDDRVRVTLRSASARAVSWDDYVTRLANEGVEVRTHGKSGVSYGWTGSDGQQLTQRARKLATSRGEFGRQAVTEQAARNADRVAQGRELAVPEAELVPARTPPGGYPTPDYRPGYGPVGAAAPTGMDTHEDRMRQAIDSGIASGASDWEQLGAHTLGRRIAVVPKANRVKVTTVPGEMAEVWRQPGVAVSLDDLGPGYSVAEIEDRMAPHYPPPPPGGNNNNSLERKDDERGKQEPGHTIVAPHRPTAPTGRGGRDDTERSAGDNSVDRQGDGGGDTRPGKSADREGRAGDRRGDQGQAGAGVGREGASGDNRRVSGTDATGSKRRTPKAASAARRSEQQGRSAEREIDGKPGSHWRDRASNAPTPKSGNSDRSIAD
ncbi:hypothetical protein ABLE94_02620 [Gordonia sp. VNK1]|uniref:hypothetical protein n=1 Tax=Gordonia oleivorans TaxID=3156618 RepID=UPI0032B56033